MKLNQWVAKPDDPIRVSELAEFVYCQRAWWLKMVCKEPSSVEAQEAQAEGEGWHQQQGAHIAQTDALSGAAYLALLIAYCCWYGCMEGTAMMLSVLTAIALVLGIVLLRMSQRRRQQFGLPNGDVFYQDHQGQPMPAVVLHSHVYNLRGRPDCLIRTAEGIIPVELKKSARPPSRGGVYPNHLIQVLAYIVLVSEHYHEPVPYGLVVYGGEAARKVLPTSENLAWSAGVIDQVRRARTAGHRPQSPSTEPLSRLRPQT